MDVMPVFILVLAVDIVCGPFLTFILTNPGKSRRERWIDFSLIGFIQLLALAYGLHSVWLGRPVVLAFEVDRLVVVSASEIDQADLSMAPEGLRHLPRWGIVRVGTRLKPRSNDEFFQSIERGMEGITLGAQPNWWIPWEQAKKDMWDRAKPVAVLLSHRPQDASTLHMAIKATNISEKELRYLPLVSRKTLNWVALLDHQMNMVGWAPVDGF